MLRSEVEWFPFFLELCKQSMTYLDEQSMDHIDMKRIVETCTGYREVQVILNQSKESAFKEQILNYHQQAKKRVKEIEHAERRLERTERRLERIKELRERILQWLEESHEYVGSVTE